MILVLSPPADSVTAKPTGTRFVEASTIDEVLAILSQEAVELVVVPVPSPRLDPVALARKLRAIGGPPVALAGVLRPDAAFWAERNGCRLATSIEAALCREGVTP